MLIFANNPVTRRRFLAGTLSDGVYTPGGYSDDTILTGVQDVEPEILALLDEGKRTRKSSYLITNYEMRLAEPSLPADWVQLDGEWYEVDSKAKCRSNVINHFEYVVLKIENPDVYLSAQL